jgi:hypothetical protein
MKAYILMNKTLTNVRLHCIVYKLCTKYDEKMGLKSKDIIF